GDPVVARRRPLLRRPELPELRPQGPRGLRRSGALLAARVRDGLRRRLHRDRARRRPLVLPLPGLPVRRAVLLLFLGAALVWIQRAIDGMLGGFGAEDRSTYLWSPAHVKRMAAGFDNVVADIYWLRTVQYFGGQRLFARSRRFELLLPLIDVTTTLDPRLEIAYRYGAIFLCEPSPIGAGRSDARP